MFRENSLALKGFLGSSSFGSMMPAAASSFPFAPRTVTATGSKTTEQPASSMFKLLTSSCASSAASSMRRGYDFNASPLHQITNAKVDQQLRAFSSTSADLAGVGRSSGGGISDNSSSSANVDGRLGGGVSPSLSSAESSQSSPLIVTKIAPSCEDESVQVHELPAPVGKGGKRRFDWEFVFSVIGAIGTLCAAIVGVISMIQYWTKATFDSEAVKTVNALSAKKVPAAQEYNSSFAQHLPGDLKERLKDRNQSWLVLLGVKGTGKTTTATQIASCYDDGPSLFVPLPAFKEGDSLAKVLFTALPRNDQEVLKEREIQFVQMVLKKSARVTIVLDITGVAADYSTVHLDKQIKALTELCGVRFIVAASEGTQWMSLNQEPRREVVFFHTLPEKIASLYYDEYRAEALDANPTWKPDDEQKRVFMEKGNLVFKDLMKAAKMEDGGVKLAETHYNGYEGRIAAVLERTCSENHRRSFAQKLAQGKLREVDLYKVCGGNFKVLAKESNMKVEDWFAQEFVVPNIAFLPDAGRQYGPQSNVVKSILLTI